MLCALHTLQSPSRISEGLEFCKKIKIKINWAVGVGIGLCFNAVNRAEPPILSVPVPSAWALLGEEQELLDPLHPPLPLILGLTLDFKGSVCPC